MGNGPEMQSSGPEVAKEYDKLKKALGELKEKISENKSLADVEAELKAGFKKDLEEGGIEASQHEALWQDTWNKFKKETLGKTLDKQEEHQQLEVFINNPANLMELKGEEKAPSEVANKARETAQNLSKKAEGLIKQLPFGKEIMELFGSEKGGFAAAIAAGLWAWSKDAEKNDKGEIKPTLPSKLLGKLAALFNPNVEAEAQAEGQEIVAKQTEALAAEKKAAEEIIKKSEINISLDEYDNLRKTNANLNTLIEEALKPGSQFSILKELVKNGMGDKYGTFTWKLSDLIQMSAKTPDAFNKITALYAKGDSKIGKEKSDATKVREFLDKTKDAKNETLESVLTLFA